MWRYSSVSCFTKVDWTGGRTHVNFQLHLTLTIPCSTRSSLSGCCPFLSSIWSYSVSVCPRLQLRFILTAQRKTRTRNAMQTPIQICIEDRQFRGGGDFGSSLLFWLGVFFKTRKFNLVQKHLIGFCRASWDYPEQRLDKLGTQRQDNFQGAKQPPRRLQVSSTSSWLFTLSWHVPKLIQNRLASHIIIIIFMWSTWHGGSWGNVKADTTQQTHVLSHVQYSIHCIERVYSSEMKVVEWEIQFHPQQFFPSTDDGNEEQVTGCLIASSPAYKGYFLYSYKKELGSNWLCEQIPFLLQ